MRHPLRTIIFWVHLATGLTAGLIVALMGGTGALMAFQPQLLEWAERPSGRIAVPPGKPARLPLDQILDGVRTAAPKTPPVAVTVYADPAQAVRVSTGGRDGFHADPYTGKVRPFAAAGWRSVFQTLIDWHRYLGQAGEKRAIGRAITGACNAAFLFLALSGLYLWWPRRWTGRSLRLSLWFRSGLAGKARDFNWHNVTGFWSLPILIVLTASGMMISYGWVPSLIARLAGEPVSNLRGPPAAMPVVEPRAGASALSWQQLLAVAEREVPRWKSVTWRPGPPARPEGARQRQAASFTIKETEAWPPFSTVQLSLDPFTAQVLRRDSYDGFTPARRVRSWLRYLHTGEALAWPGQLAAGIASLGAVLLVWTGFAMAWRRFFSRRVNPLKLEAASDEI